MLKNLAKEKIVAKIAGRVVITHPRAYGKTGLVISYDSREKIVVVFIDDGGLWEGSEKEVVNEGDPLPAQPVKEE